MSSITKDDNVSWQTPVIVGFSFDIFLILTLVILIFEAKKSHKYYYKKSDFIFISNEERIKFN